MKATAREQTYPCTQVELIVRCNVGERRYNGRDKNEKGREVREKGRKGNRKEEVREHRQRRRYTNSKRTSLTS